MTDSLLLAVHAFARGVLMSVSVDESNQYMVTVRNKFDILQKTFERHTPKDKYKNIVTAHIEAASE